MENHYTYYSYEEWGRGYFGSRSCECLPEEDVKYFGSFKDKTFKPTQKIILKDDYLTRDEAIIDEIILHNFYEVDKNPHFANKSRQKTTGFYYAEKKFGEENPFYGKSHAEETKNIIRQYQIENNGYVKNRRSYEGKDNPFYGKSHSKETIEHLKEKTTETWKNQQHPWIGRNHSEETKRKMSEDRKGNPKYSHPVQQETRDKIGQSKLGRKLWNNGEQQKFSKECPGESWVLGGLKQNKTR
jgi:hypothetical protein